MRSSESLTKITDSNHYRLIRKIADGGMGSVYEALLYGSDNFQKVVAIKTILEKFSEQREFVDMFIGEAKLVADLVHQNIVQIYQLGRTRSIYYIAMEYIHGVNLQEFIKRHEETKQKVPIDLAVFIASRVCRGLEYAHKKRDKDGRLVGVVHRDISPKNLMISSEGEVKITDFGIAKARNLMEDREGDVLMGKVLYMSPEQALYLPTDGRSDLFSLAVVLLELLSGTHSITAETAVQSPEFDPEAMTSEVEVSSLRGNLVGMAQRGIPAPRSVNPDIPEELEKILLKGLESDVNKRYQSAAEMGYDLEYYIYHKGYGPTIQTLQKHLRKLFPHLFPHDPEEPEIVAPTVFPGE